jgi:hypothetical protein
MGQSSPRGVDKGRQVVHCLVTDAHQRQGVMPWPPAALVIHGPRLGVMPASQGTQDQ